ncbi:hypothetical protein PQR64_15770 [Paraburkholderia phytofirmans]|uniref:hypothetical protein n=1 Tax=Paraburkholderia phytofirmans TaxID=261302 RepID=UPI0038BBC9CA
MNTNEAPVSLTEVLNANGIALSAVAANKVLAAAAMTETRWRESSKPGRPMKSYRAATVRGEALGIVNESSGLPTGDPVLVKYVPSMFASLWASDEVQEALADLLKAGDVKYRDGAAASQSEIF